MTLEDFQRHVGREIGTSGWVEVDQRRIDTFAACTEDHQFIHVDPSRAQLTPFGSTVAHGFLTLSLVPKLISLAAPQVDVTMSVNYGFNRIRFIAPVKSGRKIRGRFTLLQLVCLDDSRWRQTLEVVIDVEGQDKPALIAEWILLHFI
jgi:acyl dehydratase